MRINPQMSGGRSRSRIAKLSPETDSSETHQQLTKLREKATELEQENIALREELKRLREEKAAPTKLEFRENVYWLRTDSERTGPFCPRCYTQHQHLTTLLDGTRFVGKTRWICPICNHVFEP